MHLRWAVQLEQKQTKARILPCTNAAEAVFTFSTPMAETTHGVVTRRPLCDPAALAIAKLAMSDLRQALELYYSVADFDDTYPLQFELASCMFALRELDGAHEVLDAAIQVVKGNEERAQATHLRGLVYKFQDVPVRAMKYAKEAIDVDHSSSAVVEYVELVLASGCARTAVSYLSTLIMSFDKPGSHLECLMRLVRARIYTRWPSQGAGAVEAMKDMKYILKFERKNKDTLAEMKFLQACLAAPQVYPSKILRAFMQTTESKKSDTSTANPTRLDIRQDIPVDVWVEAIAMRLAANIERHFEANHRCYYIAEAKFIASSL
ncbi:Aste57867_23601 [Aphanomyces stellatus]|uniref:Aste57867_23601 protein n=1 Tax=Aphanomyces stellatus TaxID=120398 RepID=A0A485LPZ7_9STRA|nr:hypothetical protein As57867_023529 [Aphanomyces stellatus]VFU00246.1 Aste57867_23601 [Aphanomyces stellatus]